MTTITNANDRHTIEQEQEIYALLLAIYRHQMSTPYSASANLNKWIPNQPGGLTLEGLIERLRLLATNTESLKATIEHYAEAAQKNTERLHEYEIMFGHLGKFFAKVQEAAK